MVGYSSRWADATLPTSDNINVQDYSSIELITNNSYSGVNNS